MFSLHFNSHFSGGPGLAITSVSILELLELRMMAVVMTTGAIRCAHLQSNRHQQTITQLFTGQMPFLSPNSVTELKEKKIDHIK